MEVSDRVPQATRPAVQRLSLMQARLMKRRFCILVGISIVSFSLCYGNESIKLIGLNLSDFGPPGMSYDLLGQEWWQWKPHGASRPGKHYDVKVIVYRDIPLEKVKELYPVIREKEQDYRYVEYQKALNYLNREIRRLKEPGKSDEESLIPSLLVRLEETRKDILFTLGSLSDGVEDSAKY